MPFQSYILASIVGIQKQWHDTAEISSTESKRTKKRAKILKHEKLCMKIQVENGDDVISYS